MGKIMQGRNKHTDGLHFFDVRSIKQIMIEGKMPYARVTGCGIVSLVPKSFPTEADASIWTKEFIEEHKIDLSTVDDRALVIRGGTIEPLYQGNYSILSDQEIEALYREHLLTNSKKMIDPFLTCSVKKLSEWTDIELVTRPVVSFGMSSFGYDIRVSDEFFVFSPGSGEAHIVDPKDFNQDLMIGWKGDHVVIPPNSFALAKTMEHFSIPEDVITVCLGKSTYARCGIIVNVTPFEPGWEGYATLEISNTTPLPAKVYANEGIAQLLFFRGNKPGKTYADKGGRYQNQEGITPPKVT